MPLIGSGVGIVLAAEAPARLGELSCEGVALITGLLRGGIVATAAAALTVQGFPLVYRSARLRRKGQLWRKDEPRKQESE